MKGKDTPKVIGRFWFGVARRIFCLLIEKCGRKMGFGKMREFHLG